MEVSEKAVKYSMMGHIAWIKIIGPWFQKFGHWPRYEYVTGDIICLRCEVILMRRRWLEDDQFDECAAQCMACTQPGPEKTGETP